MIHELLFNLYHHPGVPIEDADWTHLFELPQFLHPGEEKLLQLIITVGMDYHKITSFTNEVLNQNCLKESGQDQSFQGGPYLTAFCNGIQEALGDYRKEIIKLENTFLVYPQLSLTYILSSVNKFKGLFEVLKSMIRKIQIEELHGCLIMSGLHQYTHCGIEQIEKSAVAIIKTINTVFYQHLCNWIVCGNLVDPFNEFFICDGKVADENFLYPEQLPQYQEQLSENANSSYSVAKKSKIRRPPPVRKFYINWEKVPMFISEDSAESILFMGRIVWIIRNDPKKDENIDDYNTKFKRDIWEDKETEYYNKIQVLADQSFNAVQFKKTIEECRIKLTKFLWSIMLEEGHLVEHLKLIRDFYALGKGELFQQFLTVSNTNLKNVPANALMQQLNFLFHETSRKIYGENDKTYQKFELSSNQGEISNSNMWQHLQLNFEIQWPLHIVFHPEVMELYNKLFGFLLRLKKTEINLLKLWSNHTLSKQKIDRRVWTLRQNLMFLVNNLQYYMQVNVIETQFSIILKAVESASEFEDFIKIHQEFITNLLAKSFVLTPDESQDSKSKYRLYQVPALQNNVPSKVYRVITRLLELCDEFSLIANTWEANLTEADIEELESFQKRSDIAIETLLVVLHRFHKKVSGGHLLQLLMHLDFNRYFSRNKADCNLTAALNGY